HVSYYTLTHIARPHLVRTTVDCITTRTVISYLLITAYHDPPAHHSFPTRRSSDLASTTWTNWWRGACRPSSWQPAPRCPTTRMIDRKSTRLNSSHVKISYAVFCLKKKRSAPARGTPKAASPPTTSRLQT